MITTPGTPVPLGASLNNEEMNFALYSTQATEVWLCLFERETEKLYAEIALFPHINKTGDIWHISIPIPEIPTVYAYKTLPLLNPKQYFLLDPYAKNLSVTNQWGKNNLLKDNESIYHPLAELPNHEAFDWENDIAPKIPLSNLIIYEMSVRAFTQDKSSNTSHPGTFLGIIEKIPYLIELGINAVELLPVQEFNECEYIQTHPLIKTPLYNFWGYSTVNFFSPMNRFATSDTFGTAVLEFKTMVKKLHQNGIEVILDVVFNHTAEGDETGPIISFKGIDNAAYYLTDEHGAYLNYSGCGNSINANNPYVLAFIIDCLCYWVTEMHVDGFRFDLASALTRGIDGTPLQSSPLIEAITSNPILSKVKLIAEPWDAAGLYQVGNFAAETKLWSEWNGKYRDGIRRFIKGSPWSSGEFATRVCGSEDLYHNRGPCNSINFITSHDGFSLADLVAYNCKHNIDNGEGNRDGSSDNISWNCGEEGATSNKKILGLREKQMKNFHLALMLSQGVPMLTMGDEYGHTKHGNNNTWCQDNTLNWFRWDQLESNASFYRFYRSMIHFRKKHPILKRQIFLTQRDVDWHGLEPFKPDWNSDMRLVAFTLKDPRQDHDLYIAFNSQDHVQLIELPPPPYSKRWRWVVNTANPSPADFYKPEDAPFQKESSYRLAPFSAIVLEATS
ncbi:MAG TPA: isoamylase [Parachlamydiaceae bacterium]|nr:isoamylase [Parachlamydiaceae bacterium]